MKKNQLLLAPDLRSMFRNAILLNILQFFLKGMPFGFLILVLAELFSENINTVKIVIYITIMFVLLLLNLWIAVLGYTKLAATSFYISGDLRLRLGEHLRKLSLGFFKNRDPGDITAPLLQDMKNYESIFSRFYPNIVASVIMPALIAIFLLYIDIRLTAILGAFVVLSIPVLLFGNKMIARLGERVVNLRTTASSMIIEYFMGMKILKAHNIKGDKFKRLDKTLNSLRKESIRLEAFVVPLVFSYMAVLEIGFIVTLLIGTSYLFDNTIQAPIFLLFLVIGNRLFDILQGLGVFIVMMRYMNVAANRISQVLEVKPLPNPDRDEKLVHFDIEFSDVSFSYSDKQVLKGISFTARGKTLTALVGPSGSGKTTITSLIARFWDVDSGEIRVGGKNIKDLKNERLLSYISIIFQDVFLFNDTVFNNIKIGKHNATYQEVIEAAKAAQCHNFIEKMPRGYDTVVGEGGSKLSGGERQRISIARAILKDAPIILLDEATASLDPENERYIQEAINKLIQSKTLIVIAHRLPTIMHADQIVVIDEGVIVEKGRHADLMSRGGLYHNLWEKQKEAHGWTFGERK